ncbi:lipid-binding SYLF domain-containing protein [Caenispirillum salinarum]|uniref:lipid-binding SYLF domain-containing protein n=1 Tax=Caenispirillum salinarum TaxID=859058 RepID=UPI00384DEC91
MILRALTLGLAIVFSVLAGAAAPAPAGAASVQEDLADARSVLNESISTVYSVRGDENFENNFNRYLQRAKGVLIVPQFFKGGFIIGGAYGNGLLMSRDRTGDWSAPAFYRMGAGSLGFQIGAQQVEMVFMIMTDRGLTALMNDEFKLGANVGVTFVHKGASLEAATTTNMQNDILAFAHAKGAYGGVSVEGAVIKPRHDWNQAFYGRGATPKAIVLDRRYPNPEAEPLWEALSVENIGDVDTAPYSQQQSPAGAQGQGQGQMQAQPRPEPQGQDESWMQGSQGQGQGQMQPSGNSGPTRIAPIESEPLDPIQGEQLPPPSATGQ